MGGLELRLALALRLGACSRSGRHEGIKRICRPIVSSTGASATPGGVAVDLFTACADAIEPEVSD